MSRLVDRGTTENSAERQRSELSRPRAISYTHRGRLENRFRAIVRKMSVSVVFDTMAIEDKKESQSSAGNKRVNEEKESKGRKKKVEPRLKFVKGMGCRWKNCSPVKI
jgi:hypothetical protein